MIREAATTADDGIRKLARRESVVFTANPAFFDALAKLDYAAAKVKQYGGTKTAETILQEIKPGQLAVTGFLNGQQRTDNAVAAQVVSKDTMNTMHKSAKAPNTLTLVCPLHVHWSLCQA